MSIDHLTVDDDVKQDGSEFVPKPKTRTIHSRYTEIGCFIYLWGWLSAVLIHIFCSVDKVCTRGKWQRSGQMKFFGEILWSACMLGT